MSTPQHAAPASPNAPVQSSLARTTLLQMGVRIAVLIGLTTLFSYLHIFSLLRTEALQRLERSVVGRALREQAIFVLAEDNHALLKQALGERFQAWKGQDPGPAFARLTSLLPDGTVRNRPEGFDGTRMPCVFVPRGLPLDDDTRRWLLASHEVLSQYGPAFHVRFTDTYVTLPGGATVLYWPESPTWCRDATPDFHSSDYEFFTLSTPEQDPLRGTVWSGIVGDPIAKTWTVSASTPVDAGGRHALTITQDILVEQLMERTVREHLPGGYNMLFRDDGQLLAHPDLDLKGASEPYNPFHPTATLPEGMTKLGTEAARAHLRRLFDWARHRPAEEISHSLPEYSEYAASTRLKGPGWNLVMVLPESVVSADALRASRYVLGFGVMSLVLELGIMYWVMRRQITRPLLTLTQATDRLAAGDFQGTPPDTSRDDELGRLARSFQHMAGEVRRREEALRQANEGLEQRVAERTRELEEVHRQLVETARQVGRAEVATNVLHNVGNVLNSVHTSAVLAKERLAEMKLDSVERVVTLFEENRANLTTFLTQDERGRNALPFLRRLSRYMQSERQELHTLLTDVSRHTEHIGAIVKLQQRYARKPQDKQLLEPVAMGEVVEEALRINQAALDRHSVQVACHLLEMPPLLTERHKVLMILVNLISNAKYAVDGLPTTERRLELHLDWAAPDRIRLRVQDNGMGIAPDMLTRIFQHGFTTRDDGHGFGLHSSALAAQEMGGSLVACSEGLGKGATFVLELPALPVPRSERAHA